jgi:hypothetical protein
MEQWNSSPVIDLGFCFTKTICYTFIMNAQTQTEFEFLPIMPIDDDTRAMLAYAASPEGRARIEQARRELQEGKGIIVTPGYFDEMKTTCRLTPQRSKLQRYMRRIIFAPSFSREADDITVYIDEQFGENASDEFISNLMAVCTLIASFPASARQIITTRPILPASRSSTTGFSTSMATSRCGHW